MQPPCNSCETWVRRHTPGSYWQIARAYPALVGQPRVINVVARTKRRYHPVSDQAVAPKEPEWGCTQLGLGLAECPGCLQYLIL